MTISPSVLTPAMGEIESGSAILTSANGLWRLAFTTDGCIKLYDSQGLFVWKPADAVCNYPAATLSLNRTNQLVIKNNGQVVWSSGAGGGIPNGLLKLEDNRNLRILDAEETVIYESGTDFSDCMAYEEKWVAGQRIPKGSVINSPNGQYSLAFEKTGRLVLYDAKFPVWGTSYVTDALLDFDAVTRIFHWEDNSRFRGPDYAEFTIDPTPKGVIAQTCLVVKDDRTVIMHKGTGGDAGIVYVSPTKAMFLKSLRLIKQPLGTAPPMGVLVEVNGLDNSINSGWTLFTDPTTEDYYLQPIWTDDESLAIGRINVDHSAGPPTINNFLSLFFVTATTVIPQSFRGAFLEQQHAYVSTLSGLFFPPVTGVALWRTTNSSATLDEIPFAHTGAFTPFYIGNSFLYIVYTTRDCLPDFRACGTGTCLDCCNPATWDPILNARSCGYRECKRAGTVCGQMAQVDCGQCCKPPATTNPATTLYLCA
eukprot:c4699_g1_i1.p1 GENE.c4699_g1_i1~~c4699_g1_i1.p1  ORF type:complete len:521 (+),score=11.18 c4699_g1_i1:125-1564(+)